jgi:uncharacterized protein YndB with AHSA1/START domain
MTMDLNLYKFRSQWQLDAAPAEVFGVLADLDTYPSWWPEIRLVEVIAPDSTRITARSWLPYDLSFVTRQSRRDSDGLVLEATMTGDLEGFSRWTLRAAGAATIAVFDEEVITRKPLLRRLAAVARPAFRANHTLMMRHGEHGLRTYVAGHLWVAPERDASVR